jgi:hypothetical protein
MKRWLPEASFAFIAFAAVAINNWIPNVGIPNWRWLTGVALVLSIVFGIIERNEEGWKGSLRVALTNFTSMMVGGGLGLLLLK